MAEEKKKTKYVGSDTSNKTYADVQSEIKRKQKLESFGKIRGWSGRYNATFSEMEGVIRKKHKLARKLQDYGAKGFKAGTMGTKKGK